MLRISFVDPSRLVSDAMRTIFAQEEDVYVVGCATNIEEALFLMPHSNIALVNSTLGQEKTLELIGEISSRYEDVNVVVSGVGSSTDEVLRYVEAGAIGYVHPEESLPDLLKKIRAAHEGKAIISPKIAAEIMTRLSELAMQPEQRILEEKVEMAALDELTNREKEVLRLIRDGYTNRKIADELVIQCGTVKNHVHNILKKLEADNRHEAASLYVHYQTTQAAMTA